MARRPPTTATMRGEGLEGSFLWLAAIRSPCAAAASHGFMVCTTIPRRRVPPDQRFIYSLASLAAAPVGTLCKSYLPGANVSITAVETSGDKFTLQVLSADAACTAGATANTPMELLVMDVGSKSVSLVRGCCALLRCCAGAVAD